MIKKRKKIKLSSGAAKAFERAKCHSWTPDDGCDLRDQQLLLKAIAYCRFEKTQDELYAALQQKILNCGFVNEVTNVVSAQKTNTDTLAIMAWLDLNRNPVFSDETRKSYENFLLEFISQIKSEGENKSYSKDNQNVIFVESLLDKVFNYEDLPLESVKNWFNQLPNSAKYAIGAYFAPILEEYVNIRDNPEMLNEYSGKNYINEAINLLSVIVPQKVKPAPKTRTTVSLIGNTQATNKSSLKKTIWIYMIKYQTLVRMDDAVLGDHRLDEFNSSTSQVRKISSPLNVNNFRNMNESERIAFFNSQTSTVYPARKTRINEGVIVFE